MKRRSGPRIGICVVVIATRDGLFSYLLTRSPEERNWRMCSHRFRSSPLQFHSSLRSDGGNFLRRNSHPFGIRSAIELNHSRFCLMNIVFQWGNRVPLVAYAGSKSSRSSFFSLVNARVPFKLKWATNSFFESNLGVRSSYGYVAPSSSPQMGNEGRSTSSLTRVRSRT